MKLFNTPSYFKSTYYYLKRPVRQQIAFSSGCAPTCLNTVTSINSTEEPCSCRSLSLKPSRYGLHSDFIHIDTELNCDYNENTTPTVDGLM